MSVTGADYPKRFTEKRCCVLIPTYNNQQQLAKVIDGVLKYTHQVIVVNDGSTDQTQEILSNYPSLVTIHLPVNKGKGFAIRTGFKAAIEHGYDYAITMDSDGQHQPADLPAFLDKLEEEPEAIIVGARNMEQDSVPGTSSFGHRFSNFWFRVDTGIKLPDTQSGFRLYPLHLLEKVHFFTSRFEFEVEVLVRSAWKEIRITSVPIHVYYPPKELRVTHFRKFTDFARISLLNAVLFFNAILFIKPFQFIRLFRKKSFRQFFREQILYSMDSNRKLAFSVSVGVFLSCAPIWGWQMVAALALSYPLKLNKLATLAASNLSIPPNMPWILYLSYVSGGLVLGKEFDISYSSGITLEWVERNLLQYLVGSIVFGIILGIVAGITSYIILTILRKKGRSRNRVTTSSNSEEPVVN
ncbi:MAG: DUF2062 domain-containing protein [Bacteroidetes bacterium]|nr:DUF2062 domain-containing protein [Bacteroidota bacterium]